MASHVDVSTDWRRSAGDFQCLECRKKRLPANRFSKTQVKAALKHEEKGAICLECMQKREEKEKAEREAAKAATGATDGEEVEKLTCSICNELVPITQFSKSQSNHIKHGRPGKCKPCIEKKDEEELAKISNKKLNEQQNPSIEPNPTRAKNPSSSPL